MTAVKSKIDTLEKLLREITDAAYSVLCESNGLSDNEWKTGDGTFVPRWPVDSFPDALGKLNEAYSEAKAYFEPSEAELRQKWSDACATANFIVDRFDADQRAGKESPNLIKSSLMRNIADAIHGGLKQTAEDRREGRAPTTMTDKIDPIPR